MSETKHTPGPWKWDDDEVWVEGYDTEQHAPWLVGPAGERVLTGQIHCLSELDARLIAAAPELLSALERMVEARKPFCALPGIPKEFQSALDRAFFAAIAAIAKATGALS